MQHTLGIRGWLDIAYFMLILVIMLNIIFGIIIDTFSSLREEKEKRDYDTKNICFICGQDKDTFERNADAEVPGAHGWKDHYHLDHNMWAYAFFMISLWEQDKDDDDGLELFVRKNIPSTNNVNNVDSSKI